LAPEAVCVPPLDDITVVDLTRYIPGPHCTLQLAQLGARVIAVVDPRGADPVFEFLARGKEVTRIDLRDPAGRGALDGLLAQADVCVEAFRPSTARQFGVDGATLTARYPRLVHCSITGYGQTGPRAEEPGHDLNYQALAGLLSPAPTVPSLVIADVTASLHAAIAILAALYGRDRTGRGRTLDISLHEAAASWLPFARLPRIGGEHACYNVYETADSEWLALGALEPKFWARFCAGAGRGEWIDLQFAEGPRQAALVADVRALFRSRARDEWLRAFENIDCCLTTVAPFARVGGARPG
jgi:alpha-methylacyl-CoA racemase